MYGLAVSASMMAFVLLGLLYVLFNMGLQENMYPLDDGVTKDRKGDCSLQGRVNMMVLAWNDTTFSPKNLHTDPNVNYKIWSSNVIRRGLDPVYTDPKLFTELYHESRTQQITEKGLARLMAPYYEKELQNAKQNMPKTMPLQPVCMN